MVQQIERGTKNPSYGSIPMCGIFIYIYIFLNPRASFQRTLITLFPQQSLESTSVCTYLIPNTGSRTIVWAHCTRIVGLHSAAPAAAAALSR